VPKAPPAWVIGTAVLLLAGKWAIATERPRTDPRAVRIQGIVDRLRGRFEIPNDVLVELVDVNPRVASVQPMQERRGVFLLSIQRTILDALAENEIEAIVAHELGHVWIYTHHPYLQTEQLANRIAMRHVTREQLTQVYQKVWGAGGMTEDLAAFLGVPAPPDRQVGVTTDRTTTSPK
jgi:hypothetical protein